MHEVSIQLHELIFWGFVAAGVPNRYPFYGMVFLLRLTDILSPKKQFYHGRDRFFR